MWEGKTLRGFQGFIRVVQLTLSEHLLHPTPLAGSEDSSVTKRREQGEVFRVARRVHGPNIRYELSMETGP